jgi:hypothetical protein
MSTEDTPQEDFRDQWSDVNKSEVLHLVRATKNFMVWIDQSYDIDWKTSKEFDKGTQSAEPEFQYTIATIGELECVPTSQHESAERLNYKRILGEALVLAFGRKYNEANTLLDSARTYIQKRNIELARKWQLITSLVYGTVAAGVAVGAVYAHSWINKELSGMAFEFTLAFLLGCIGAVFSVALRLGQLNPSSDAPRILHILEGICRITAGGIGAIIAIAAYRSGIILSVLQQSPSPMAAFAVLALSAGASERLAPSIVETINTHKEKTNE